MNKVVSCKDLKFRYPKSKDLILDISNLDIDRGEKVFIQGASGSGKSTLLNVLAGVLNLESGNINILEKSLTDLSLPQKDKIRGDHMGFIFQMFNLLPYFNAVENVMLPCEFSNLKKEKLSAESISVKDEAYRLLSELKLDPKELEKKPVTSLSVGQQQRVATARALIGRPEIIIADEPTSALDSNVRDKFIELLFDECKKSNITLIFVSHDQGLCKSFDRTIVLNEINRVSSPLKETRL